MLDPDQSVTQWIRGLKGGDEVAAAHIWDRFFRRVAGLARKRLGDLPRGARDEEDLALSALNALCDGARNDRFQRLDDRDDLWSLLTVITVRKVIDAHRREGRRSEIGAAELEAELDQLAEGAAFAPEGDYLDVLSLTSRELLENLDDRIREVALLRLQGYSNAEIATRTGRSVPTVERHLRMIRHAWTSE